MDQPPPEHDPAAYVHSLMSAAAALVERTDDELRQEVDDIRTVTRALEERIARLRKEQQS